MSEIQTVCTTHCILKERLFSVALAVGRHGKCNHDALLLKRHSFIHLVLTTAPLFYMTFNDHMDLQTVVHCITDHLLALKKQLAQILVYI